MFQVDENDYAAILAQVKTAEFEKEVQKRIEELLVASQAEQKAKELEAQKREAARISLKDQEIAKLSTEVARLNGIVANNEANNKAALAAASESKTKELAELSAKKDKQIADLRAKVEGMQVQHKLDIIEERNSCKDDLHAKEQTISQLTSQLKAQEMAAENKVLELKEYHSAMIKAKDEELEHYKDLKSRLSTKMLGETLEQHCQNTFNMARSMGQFADAYFEKDNDISTGSKGDFIFRDYIDGQECLSIMFEMKNEMDATASKHRNDDFLDKLDKDRRRKGCEYAVLVSMLEQGNELYDTGIVDKSHVFPKMLVIRPQFFLPVLRLITQTARNGFGERLALMRELDAARSQSMDFARFEEKINKFKTDFNRNITAAHSKFVAATEGIDKTIEALELQIKKLREIKANFEASEQRLLKADELAEERLTVKKLTYGNPAIRRLIDAAKD